MSTPQPKRRSRKPRSSGEAGPEGRENGNPNPNAFLQQQNMSNIAGPRSRPSSAMSDKSRGGNNNSRTNSSNNNNNNNNNMNSNNGGSHSRTGSRQSMRDGVLVGGGRDGRGDGNRNEGNGRADNRASSRQQNTPSGPKKNYSNSNSNAYANNNSNNMNMNNNIVDTQTKAIDPTQKYNMNYCVLQQHDPKLGQIFYTTTVGSIYIYDNETEEWNKSYCQGPLFLYSRVTDGASNANNDNNGKNDTLDAEGHADYDKFAPYALMALNRLSMTNFSLAITPRSVAAKHGVETVSIYKDGDFLIVRSPEEVTYCIYLYKEEERKSIIDGVEWCLNVEL